MTCARMHKLRDGDSLATLAALYGVTAQSIVAANGIPWSSKAIYEWALSLGGYYTGGYEKDGTAIVAFRGGEIAIPCPVGCCAPEPATATKPVAGSKPSSGFPWWILVVGALAYGVKEGTK
jgi:hypothetical protein